MRTTTPMPPAGPARASAPQQGLERALLCPRDLSVRQMRGLVVTVACAHIAAIWLALQVPAVRQAVRQVADPSQPVRVSVV
ncbi:MAG TPA: hypothetical protein PLA97_21965, partial [Rubrivivax sp.]|nr:hypothetical protein [Rubrivivax sp.]